VREAIKDMATRYYAWKRTCIIRNQPSRDSSDSPAKKVILAAGLRNRTGRMLRRSPQLPIVRYRQQRLRPRRRANQVYDAPVSGPPGRIELFHGLPIRPIRLACAAAIATRDTVCISRRLLQYRSGIPMMPVRTL
jgi:hypothetical protein